MEKLDIKNAALKFKGWSLYKLARSMGLPNQSIYDWQNGKVNPKLDSMIHISEVLECKIGDLFVEV